MSAIFVSIVGACLALVLLTFAIGVVMLVTRVGEMRRKRIHPQAASTSVKMAAQLENVQAADNFRNLLEVPVLFYALVALALASSHVPPWLATGAWLFVALRVAHSVIHCTYNKVYHRLAVFTVSFGLLVCMWVAFFFSLAGKSVA